MGRVANSQQQGRTKTRRRRIAADFNRAARNKQAQAAAAEAIAAVGARDDAVREVQAAEILAGDALTRIIEAGVKVGAAARLCHLSVGKVQRLRQAALQANASRGRLAPASPDPVVSPGVTLRLLGAAQSLDDVQARPRGREGARSPEGARGLEGPRGLEEQTAVVARAR